MFIALYTGGSKVVLLGMKPMNGNVPFASDIQMICLLVSERDPVASLNRVRMTKTYNIRIIAS